MAHFDEAFRGMAEGTVPDVVQESSEPCGIAVFVAHGGHVLVAVAAEEASMGGIPLERPDHALGGLHDPA